MATANIKEEARKLIDKMPDDSTWDDLMHKIYVRQAIESGLADSQAAAPPASKRYAPSMASKIVYYLKPDQIDVLAIIHGAQQIPPRE